MTDSTLRIVWRQEAEMAGEAKKDDLAPLMALSSDGEEDGPPSHLYNDITDIPPNLLRIMSFFSQVPQESAKSPLVT
jgi:hypothetical protein